MKEEYVEIKPQNAIPVFNFNYSTIMLFRCAETRFSKSFINGEIHFSQPKDWIEKGENGNNTQGDRLEGIFLTTDQNDNSDFIKHLKENEEIECIEDEKHIHFRTKQIKQCYSVCFYGLNDNSFKEKKIDEKGIAHYYSRVRKKYFEGFSTIKNRQEYERLEKNKRTSVAFVNNPQLFFKILKNKLLNDFNLDENEIIISPVEYINKKLNFISMIPYPLELLLKDKLYENQCEIRIIINTKNEKFIEHMKNNNGNINIGDITDICQLYDYYFDDLLIENPAYNVLLYNLPIPINENIEDMSLSSILKSLKQVMEEDGEKLVNGDRAELINYIKDLLWEKYKIIIHYDNEKHFTISNADSKIFEMLNRENKTAIEKTTFNKKVDDLINNNMLYEAIKELKREAENQIHEDSINYYISKIYERKNLYKEAIENYSICVEKKMRKGEALNSRSQCYTKLKQYVEAINDLKLLQETIGYNYEIYSNIGINYIYMGKNLEAISYFNKSLQMEKKNPYAYYNRGIAYFRLGDYAKFEKDVKKALELDPNNSLYQDTYKKWKRT